MESESDAGGNSDDEEDDYGSAFDRADREGENDSHDHEGGDASPTPFKPLRPKRKVRVFG